MSLSQNSLILNMLFHLTWVLQLRPVWSLHLYYVVQRVIPLI